MPASKTHVLSSYLKQTVADRLLNDYTEDEFDKRKVEFLLGEYAADASEARRIYRLDAGIDAFEIDEDDEGNAIVSIWQLSGPDEAQIKAGTVLPPPGKKLSNDLSALADGLASRQQHMSDAAADAVSLIVDKLQRAHAAGKGAVIRLHVLSLYDVTSGAKAKGREAAERRLPELFPSTMQLGVECNVYGLSDYAAADAGSSGVGPHLEDLTISLASPNSMAEYSTSYLAFAKPGELVTYYQQHGAALLHTNARFFLGKGKGTANKAIESSAQETATAKRFHELNNGLVITCASVTPIPKSGATTALRLARPQVVNGGQTLHTLTDVRRGEAKGKKSALSDLVLPVKIVVLKNSPGDDLTERAAEIAKASNTQAALSLRALASYAGANARLQRAFAKLPSRWFFEKTDGEWSTFRKTTDDHRKAITGIKKFEEFQFKPAGGKRPTSRILKNSDVLEALLSAYGCFEDATKKRMFEREVHPAVLNSVLTAAEWASFEANKEPSSNYSAFTAEYPGTVVSTPPVQFLLLTWTLFRSVRRLSLPEVPAQKWAMRYWTDSSLGGPFKDYDEWINYRDTDPNADVFENAEHVANAMQKPIVFQMLRLLARRYGPLDEATCSQIMTLPQFSAIAGGEPIEQVLQSDACREARIGEPSTPIYTLYQLCRHACGIVYQGDAKKIGSMGTKQQALLASEWVRKLSSQVDALSGNLMPYKTKLLTGADFVSPNLTGALPNLGKSAGVASAGVSTDKQTVHSATTTAATGRAGRKGARKQRRGGRSTIATRKTAEAPAPIKRDERVAKSARKQISTRRSTKGQR